METNVLTAQRLHTLADFYQQGQMSQLMERTLNKLFRHEAEECRRQLKQLQSDLFEFEEKYNLSTADFYQQFQNGQTDDRMDYVEWASLAQMANNLEKRLRLLNSGEQA